MASVSGASPAPRPGVILLVDDEPDILLSVKTLLEATIPGLLVITASSGRIGLEILERERVDVILSDLRMPEMDGIEFLSQACRLHPTIPRAMFTAFGTEELARRAVIETLCSAFINKATDPEVLIDKVVKLLSHVQSPTPPPPLPSPASSAPAATATKRKSGP